MILITQSVEWNVIRVLNVAKIFFLRKIKEPKNTLNANRANQSGW